MNIAHISAVIDLAPARSVGCGLLLIFVFPFFHAFEKMPPKIIDLDPPNDTVTRSNQLAEYRPFAL
jgi:hypothetical protein